MLFSPANHTLIVGDLRPRSKFLGNSAATLMGGAVEVEFLDRPDDGTYRITMPNMFVSFFAFFFMLSP